MAEFILSTASASEVAVDLLVLPVFEGPEPGPGVRDVREIDLMGAYAAAKHTGKRGEILRVPGLGKVGATTVLLVGLGPRGKTTTDTLRRAIGRVAPQLAKHETAATTLPQAVGRSA